MIARRPHRPPAQLASAVCVAVALAAPAPADEATLAPLKDNTIFSESNSRSNGIGIGLFAGRTAPRNNGAIRRALLAFDIAAAVPAGATITSARLELRVTMSIAGSEPVTVHRLLADWGEAMSNAGGSEGTGAPAQMGDVTWRFRFFNDTSTEWDSLGGDFVGVASASAQAGNSGTVTWGSTAEMVADVQGWLDAPAGNFGWIVVGNESQTTTAKRFGSGEETTASSRPRLVLEFEPSGNPPTPTAVPPNTPSPTITPADTPTSTLAPTDTRTAIVTNTATLTLAPTGTRTPTISVTNTATPTLPPTGTRTSAIAPTSTRTPVVPPTETPPVSPTASATPTASHTATVTPDTAQPSATAEPTQTATPTAVDSASPTPEITATASDTPGPDTPTATSPPEPTATATPIVAICPGDCDGSGTVEINELITCVNIALGTQPPSVCPACDPSGGGTVEINELIAAVNRALSGCVPLLPL